MSRGIAMYQSLLQHEKDFHLYIFAFDEVAQQTLEQMNLAQVTVIGLAAFEDEELLRVKNTRSKGEYCWTCTSSTIYYCLKHFPISNCTYVDADLFFYASPRILIDEIPSDKHVMITEHRYTRYYDQSKVSGKYCVQFMYFDDSAASLEVLSHWRNQCIDWCYNRIEDGKFGDQKYLDAWTGQFSCIHELKHLGGGLAPWNIQQYNFTKTAQEFMGEEIRTHQKFPVIFFHFHGVKLYDHGQQIYAPNTYHLSNDVKTLFYLPYIQSLEMAKKQIQLCNNNFDTHGSQASSNYFKDRYIKGQLSYIISNVFKNIFHL